MARYRKISPRIWNNTKFRSLSNNAKLVFFMLLTHPLTSSVDVLDGFPQRLVAETGWSMRTFRNAFRELLNQGILIASEDSGLIWNRDVLER